MLFISINLVCKVGFHFSLAFTSEYFTIFLLPVKTVKIKGHDMQTIGIQLYDCYSNRHTVQNKTERGKYVVLNYMVYKQEKPEEQKLLVLNNRDVAP